MNTYNIKEKIWIKTCITAPAHNFEHTICFIKLKDPQHFMGVVQVFKELLNNLSISS